MDNKEPWRLGRVIMTLSVPGSALARRSPRRAVTLASFFPRLWGSRGELFDAPLSPVPTIGTPVSIAIRRDRIHVGRAPGEKAELQPNSVAGVVESTEFQGNFVKVNILVERGGPFVANVSDEEYFGELVKPGDRVVPRWNPEHVHVLSKADSNNAQKLYSEE